MKIQQKIFNHLNECFKDELRKAFYVKFAITVTTYFDIISMANVTVRDDGEELTQEQYAFISGFEDAYISAMDKVSKWYPGK